MSRSDRERLGDAARHLRSALDACRLESFDQLWADRTRRQALIFDLVIVSETLTKLTAETKALSGRVPWRMITDTRNRLIHVYWRQDRIFFEEVLRTSAPDLLEALEALSTRLDDVT